jgi:hypothetical protein
VPTLLELGCVKIVALDPRTTLIDQIREQRLDEHPRIIGLGGQKYRAIIGAAFETFGKVVEFPFAGLPIGRAMQATKRTTQDL